MLVAYSKKADYDTKTEKKLLHHDQDKYITTPEFNKSAADIFPARLGQANSITITSSECSL